MRRKILLVVAALLAFGASGALGWLQESRGWEPRLPILLLPLAFTVVSAYSARVLLRQRRVRPNGRVALSRMRAKHAGLSRVLGSLLFFWIAFTALEDGQLSLDSLGFSREVHPLLAFGAGTVLYGVFFTAAIWTIRRLGREDELEDLGMQALALIVPRGRADKALMWVGVVVLNPFFEEILFRGILVHHLGYVTGHVGLAVATGLVVNAINHAYQGMRMQAYHVAFYACTIGLLYSPVGLVGAIGFHFLGDLVPVTLMRRDLRRYRIRHSAKRAVPG